MSAPTGHIHITEREPDGSWEDCTWVAGLEWYRLTHDASKPATHAEAQALRDASGKGPTGGSNNTDFKRGVKARYGVALTEVALSGASALWAALRPGHAATVAGSMSVFGPLHPLSRFDRNFDGGHEVFVARMDAEDRVWWCDPEAPLGVGYTGQWVSKADLFKFVNAFSGTSLVAPLKTAPVVPVEDPMDTLTSYLPGYTADVKPASNIRSAPHIAATKLLTTTANYPVVLTGTVKGDVDPANGSDVWYVWFNPTAKRWEYTAKDNVVNLKAPASPVTDCTAEVKAATDPLKAEVVSLQAQNAAQAATINKNAIAIDAQRVALDAATAKLDRIKAKVEGLIA